MRIVLIIIFIIQHTYLLSGQNLVKNAGFELLYENYSFKSIDPFDNPDSLICQNWYVLNNGTPDYWVNGSLKKYKENGEGVIPENIKGKAFLGLCISRFDGYTEHVTGEIRYPLMKDSIYKFGLMLCSLKKFNHHFVSKIGVKFLTNKAEGSLSKPYYEYILQKKVFADIEINVSDQSDTICWRTYNAEYVAKGGEKYFTIGMFYQDQEKFNDIMDNLWLEYSNRLIKKQSIFILNEEYRYKEFWGENMSYYFIDDVSLVEIGK